MSSAFVLDVTRLTSRLGRGAMTGIDRVEAAYLNHLLTQDSLAHNGALQGLVRTRFGYLLLGRAGCQYLSDLLAQKIALPKKRGAALLRPFAIARAPHFWLHRLLRGQPKGAVYINVGHSNLSAASLAAIGDAGLTRAVMIHDTIPLDHPDFARAGTQAPFQKKIAAVARHADIAVHISQDARRKTESHFARAGRVPTGITAHLGIRIAAPSAPPIAPTRPYFIALGTIEPRKNLKLLFDIWQELGAELPQLVVVGANGWADAALFDQMATLQRAGWVMHGDNLSDGAVASLLKGAIALLFPSRAEGYGLPPQEAAALGTPVVASDLPVLRETCGDNAVYLDPMDSYSWMETIKSLATAHSAGQERKKGHDLPRWADHFNIVLSHLAQSKA